MTDTYKAKVMIEVMCDVEIKVEKDGIVTDNVIRENALEILKGGKFKAITTTDRTIIYCSIIENQ